MESDGPKSLAVAVSLLAPEVQVLDMPVDPNEPTYCLCHQVRTDNCKDTLVILLLIHSFVFCSVLIHSDNSHGTAV